MPRSPSTILHVFKICIAAVSLLCAFPLLLCTCQNRKNSLTLEQLKNMFYSTEWTSGNIVRLTDGEYEERATDSAAPRLYFWLDSIYAIGDINFDERGDAVVLLGTNAGGSGTFYDLAAVIDTPDGPKHVSSVFLGDRVRIHSISIDEDIIAVDMTTHGPEDPMCCPTMEVTWRYVLDGDDLIRFRSNMDPVEEY